MSIYLSLSKVSFYLKGQSLSKLLLISRIYCCLKTYPSKHNRSVLEPEKIVVFPDKSQLKSIYVSRVEVAEILPYSFDVYNLLENYFRTFEAYNDIALLELSTRLNINIYTPVCLPKSNIKHFDESITKVLVHRDYTWYGGWSIVSLNAPIKDLTYCLDWKFRLGYDAHPLQHLSYLLSGVICSVTKNGIFLRPVRSSI